MHSILLRYLTVVTIAVIGQIFHMFYNIMRTSENDLLIINRLGATKHAIKLLILLQAVLLMIASILIGLLGGYTLTWLIIHLLDNDLIYRPIMSWINSFSDQLIIAGVFACQVLILGAYFERRIKGIPG